MRILIVDDSADLRSSFCQLLESEGHQCCAVSNGREALDHLSNSAIPPDAILLDLMMPQMDGWQFLRAQTSHPLFAAIPVVVITGSHEARSSILKLGAADFLEKPVEPDLLIRAFENLASPEVAIV